MARKDLNTEEIKTINTERNYNIVKSNDLIQKTKFELSLQEQKIIMYLISKIKPDDKTLKEQEFNISDFCKICGIDFKNGKNYKNLKLTLQKLYDKSSWIETEKEILLFSWLSYAKIIKGTGTIKIKLHEFLEPYLLELRERFTKYSLYYLLAMKSQYSIRLYEILKSFEFKQNIKFNIDDLKKLLGAEKYYSRFSDFKKNILDITLREINDYTDIDIFYVLEKKSQKYVSVMFNIKLKDNISDRMKIFSKVEKDIGYNFEDSYLNKI